MVVRYFMRPLTALALALIVGFALAVSRGNSAEYAPMVVPPSATFASDELLVTLAETSDGSPPELLARLGVEWMESYSSSGVHRVRLATNDILAAAAELTADSRVRFAEPNYRLRLTSLTPTDPRYADQEGYWNLVGAPDAWEITTGSQSVVVAVLDGAVDLDHPDLAANIWTNPGEIPGNGRDDDANGFVDDVHGYDFVGAFAGGAGPVGEDSNPDVFGGDSAAGDGLDQDHDGTPDGAVGHGTRVAGIIAAAGDNGTGVVGAAWNVSLMPLRVTGPEGDGFFSSFVRALDYAVANGAHIANLSLAAPFLPRSAELAIEAAIDAGLILVAAAGNDGGVSTLPAAVAGVIAVGSHGALETPNLRAPFSPRQGKIDLVAPGINVLTTDVEPISAAATFGLATGTSFSAPFVSGAIALMRAVDPTIPPDAILELLQQHATDLPDAALPRWDGAGRVHFGRTMSALQASSPSSPIIINADLTSQSLNVSGLATPGSTVRVHDVESDTPLGLVSVSPSGTFTFAADRNVVLSTLPETRSTLSLVATAETEAGLSEPSSPAVVGLPRTVTLQPGWNLISWAGATLPGSDVLDTMPSEVSRVFAWNGTGWDIAQPGSTIFFIDTIRSGQGMWVYLDSSRSVVWEQVRSPLESVTLTSGWQLVTWSGPTSSVTVAAGTTAATILRLIAWNAIDGVFRSFSPRIAEFPGSEMSPSQLTELPHLAAVWVFVEGAGGQWPVVGMEP